VKIKKKNLYTYCEQAGRRGKDYERKLNIIRVIKPRRMGWARHVSRMGERRSIQKSFGAVN
jgi:hypothetical protein